MIWYLLIVAVVFGRALFPPEGQMIFGDDIHRSYYFFREFFNLSVSQGIFPWWNPYMFSGEPFIANPVVNIWYPINWLFSLLPLTVAYSWHIAFHVFWAMVGMKRMMREIKGIGEIGGWIGGFIFGLSGFFMARTHAGHVDVIAAASWIPWVVWAFYRLIRTKGIAFRTSFVVASIVFALQLFSGYQTMAMMSVIIIGILTIGECIQQKHVRPIVYASAAGITGVLLAAIQVLPVAEFFRMSIRTYSFPYAWHAYGSLEWRSVLQLLNPFIFGNVTTYAGPPPNFVEHSMFVGIGGLVLMVIGGIRDRREIWGKIFALVAIFGLWVSLGSNAPIDLQYFLWKYIPMYHYLRIPPRHIILVVFGLAGLAGIGLGKWKHVQPFIVGIIVVELVWFGRGFIEMKPIPQSRHDTELIAILSQDKEPYRVLQNYGAWLHQRDAMDFDSGLSYGIFSATGYDPSILRPYFEYISGIAGQSGEKAVLSHDVQVPYLNSDAAAGIDRLNIKYIQVPRAYDPFVGALRYRKLIESQEFDYRLYENTSVLPRFFLKDACGTVEIVSYTPNQIALSVNATCDTTLESSEVWYPGWDAYIDNKKTRINKTDNVFRTLFITPGNHVIVYRYVPRIFAIGAGISVGTFVAILLFVFLPQRFERKNVHIVHPPQK